MGAESFVETGKGKTASEAFNYAVGQAQYEHGHGGYSGTLAEKHDFVMISLPENENAQAYAYDLIEKGDERIDDKWGPAGCIDLGDGKYMFFGWASS